MDRMTPRACRPVGWPCWMVLVLACATPVLAADPPEGEVRVARLIKDLGAPEFSKRQTAHSQLSKLGPDGGRQLEQARNDPDPEVRLQAQRLLGQLKLEELWQSSRVNVQAGDEPASKLLLEMAAQTGNHVYIGDPYGTFTEQKLDARYADCTYWEAIDDICRRTGNRLRPHYDMHTPGVVVSAGSAGRFPRAYAGPVRAQITSARRVFIEELNYEEHKAELTHSFHVTVQFTWEDKFRIVGYATQPELVEGVTDNHVILSAAQPPGGGWNATTRGLRQVTASLKLNPVPVSAQTLEVFTIRWGLIAVGEPTVLEIKDFESQRVHSQDDLSARVESIDKQPGGKCLVALCVQRDLAMPEPYEVVFQEYEADLIDDRGQPYRLQNVAHALVDRGVQLKFTFSGESADSQPQALKLHYPRIRARRDLPITFRNVPLPVEKPE